MVHWGIIGLGNIAARFSKSLSHSKDGYLYAVASRGGEKCIPYTEKFGCKAYSDYEQLLSDKKVDAVYIALPPGLHLKWCCEALGRKKPVLCEKPSAISGDEIRQIVECARENGVFFMEAMKSRFCEGTAMLHREIDSGAIGEITSITANFCSDLDSIAERSGCYAYEPGQGGTLLDMGPYPVSFFMDFLGSGPLKIESQMLLDDNGVDHRASGRLYYDNAVADFEVAFNKNVPRMAIINGTKGSIEAPYYYRPTEYTVVTPAGRSRVECPLEVDDMFGEISEIHRLLAAGELQSPRFSWQDSIAQMDILCQIRRAAKKENI